MPVTLVKSSWSSGELIFHEKTSWAPSTTYNVFKIGTTAVKVGDTANDIDFQYYGTGSLSAIIDCGAATFVITGLATTHTGILTVSNTTDASSLTAGASVVAGGIACAKKLFIGDDIDMSVSGTGIYDMVLKTNVADALSVKDSAGDLIVFNTTTGSQAITITPATSITGALSLASDIDLSASGTGTYDLILKDAVADALSIRRATTDVIVFNTTTPSVTITPATTITGALTCSASASVGTTLGVTGILTSNGGITMGDAQNIILNATTGTKIGTATTQKLGFFGAAPIVQAGAYTQTYATADKTHAAFTATSIAAVLPAAAPAGGAGTAAGGWDTAANRDAAITTINDLRTWAVEVDADYEALLVDVADIKQLANSVIDDLQALGLVA